MAKPYSQDLRERVIAAVDAGSSRRQAAALFRVGVSTVVEWLARWRRDGEVRARPMGGDQRSSLTGQRAWLLARIAETPDLTLLEIRAELAGRGVAASYGAVRRFFVGEKISFKKNPARRRAGSSGRRRQARAVAAPAAGA